MKWIKIEDKKPKEGQNCLVYGSWEDENSFLIAGWQDIRFVAIWAEEDWHPLDTLCKEEHYVIKVTHWMPLPEKPKEKE